MQEGRKKGRRMKEGKKNARSQEEWKKEIIMKKGRRQDEEGARVCSALKIGENSGEKKIIFLNSGEDEKANAMKKMSRIQDRILEGKLAITTHLRRLQDFFFFKD